ncbi:MAG: Gfo/Idh/MocA family oxidoreductase [Anaerolineae bacterium]|nr:Gfo/Idh/MocA family oxidoreductase [Anaerolineae bacterium]
MTRTIRWGILSTANIANRRVAPALKATRNGEVAAVASREIDKAQQFATDHGIPKAYGSYGELLTDPEIDAIYIPLPNSEHARWGNLCAEAGKAVLCEKPLARDATEAQMLVSTFAEKQLLLVEGFMYRFHPQTVKVREMLKSGAVGEITALSSAFSFSIRSETNVRLNPILAGGALMDVGCYCINVMRLMTGEEPETARALAHFGASNVDERLAATVQFPSGAIGHFDCGLRGYRTHTYEIRGTEGRILVERGFTMEPGDEHIIRWWHGDDYEEVRTPMANHFTLMAEDFADALLTGRQPRYPATDAVHNMRAIDMVREAAVNHPME